MRPVDIYALTSVGDPRLSPDARRVAYVVNRIDGEANRYRSAIWVASVDGSEEPRQLTSGERSDGSPRWSPDGRWLALVDSLYELEVDVEGSEPRRLSHTDESASMASFSPDGSLIAYRHEREDGTYPHHGQIAVMRADGSERRVLTTSLDRQCTPYPLV